MKNRDSRGKFNGNNLDFLMKRVIKTSNCWIWNGLLDKEGYGKVGYNYKTYKAHRLIYELLTNTNIKGSFLCHKCDNPKCVNPKHMFLGNQKDNILDRDKKGRGIKGEIHPQAKLTEKEVLEIRELYKKGKKTKELALKFNVHKSTIDSIIYYRNWKWL